jgi:hypothetical protein
MFATFPIQNYRKLKNNDAEGRTDLIFKIKLGSWNALSWQQQIPSLRFGGHYEMYRRVIFRSSWRARIRLHLRSGIQMSITLPMVIKCHWNA